MVALLVVCAGVPAEQYSIHLAGSAQPSCSSVEEIVAEVTMGAATGRQKALALHRFGMAHFIHFDGPIEERGEYVTDPMKLIGVYGYALCGNNSAAMNALYNAAGLRARTRTLPGHAVPEVWFEGKWNYIDTDMFGYVFLPDGKSIASVDDLAKDADLFLRQASPPDPYYPFDEKKDMASVFRNVRAQKNYHPYANAHLMNLSLRTGESASLYYRPQGRGRYFLTPAFRPDLGIVYKDYWILGPVRRGSLAWCDKPPASYGNGVIRYEPDLRSEAFRLENPARQGIAVRTGKQSPPLAAAATGGLASLVVEVTTPWVIAGLQNDLINFQDNTDGAVVSGLFWRLNASDENRILVSTDSGRTWKKVWENRYLGAVPFEVDLTQWVEGEYGYRVKFEWLDRKGSRQVGLEGLKFKTWVELSPMALPRLNPGKNTFRLTTQPRRAFYNHSRWDRGQSLPGEQLENLQVSAKAPFLRPADPGRPGILTFAVGPEGVVEELRVAVLARALRGSQGVSLALSLSEDGGTSWKELERFAPHPEHEMNHMWFNHVIRNSALNGDRSRLRIAVSGGGLEQVIANSLVRSIPRASSALRVTHVWREGDQQRTASQVFRSGSGTYEVNTAAAGLVNEELRTEGVAP